MSEPLDIATEPMENRQVRLTVNVPASIVDPILRKTARRLGGQVRVPGFRSGKAPFAVVERRIGRETLVQESLETLVEEVYADAIKQADIEPGGPPSLEDFAPDPLALTFVVPLQPLVELGDYSGLRVDYKPPTVDPEAVDKAIQELRDRRTTWAPVERAAQYGDLLTVDISGKVDEESVIDQENWDIELSESEEGMIPGLDAAFVGLSAGETKSFELTYPEDSTSQWAGRTAQFETTVHVVKATAVPSDEELAREAGDYDDIAALRAQLASNLLEEATEATERDYRRKVIEMFVRQAPRIEFPPDLLEKELDSYANDQETYYQSLGLDMKSYLRFTNQTPEAFRYGLRSAAEQRLKQRLALLYFASLENIHVHREDIEAEIQEAGDSMKDANNAAAFRDLMHTPGGQQYVAETLVQRQAMERLVALAQGNPLPPLVHEHEDEREHEDAEAADVTGEAVASSEEKPDVTPEAETSEELETPA